MLLALFLFMTGEVVARANAAKNLVLGVSNGIAAVGAGRSSATSAGRTPPRWPSAC